ncbi:hypothetical protein [Peribacillus simplex]|uniref:hypothetical protein n=1 Tax=Peribacillus simplex TaxID=1478 RepID=UPI003D2C6056
MEVSAVDSPEESGLYAGFWLRFGANIIDGIIIGIPTGILSVFMSIFLSGADGIRGKDNGSFIFTHA